MGVTWLFSFKECGRLYIKVVSPVCTCFLDASKALQCVNHLNLSEKLRIRGLLMCIIEILSYLIHKNFES